MQLVPKTEYLNGYWVEAKSNYKVYEWRIIGGSFKDKFGQLKDNLIIYQNEIVSGNSLVTVIWKNVKSNNGKAPKGSITINTYQNETLTSGNINGRGKIEQEIKSLNDIIPGNLVSDPISTTIPIGSQSVKVFLEEDFNFPGIKLPNGMPVPVLKYEWKIPQGWKPKTGEAPSPSGTYFTNWPVIEVITDEDSDGEVMVRGVNDCFDSNDFSEYSYPKTFTRSGLVLGDYPETVPLGESNTYTFSVCEPQGEEFEWRAPTGWKINNGGNSLKAGNSVEINTGTCYTEEKVKVELYVNGEVSGLTEFPTTVALPTINIPTGEIVQYQLLTFSLDMPDDNIETVEWLVNGNPVGTAMGKSSKSFTIKESGNVNISALLTIKGCAVVSIPEIEIDVVEAPEPKIVGPNNVCSDDEIAYTVENLPEGTPFLWSTSSDLAVVSETSNSLTVKRNHLLYMNPTSYIIADIGEPYNKLIEYKINVWKRGINETTDLLDIRFNSEGGGGMAILKGDLPYTGARGFRWSASDNWTIILQDDYMTYFEGPNNINEGGKFIAVEFLNPCGESTTIIHRFPSNSTVLREMD